MNANANKKTIEAYNKNVEAYIRNTPKFYTPRHAKLIEWIDHVLSLVPLNAKVLEIGSATARDANYMRSKGYSVTCSDAAERFVEKLRAQNEPVLLLNILTQNVPGRFNLIFANAVVQHFTPDDLAIALEKIYAGLTPGGVLAFNAKAGTGDHWVNEKFYDKRYTHLWRINDLRDVVLAANFEIVDMEEGIIGDLPSHIWIRINARRPLS